MGKENIFWKGKYIWERKIYFGKQNIFGKGKYILGNENIFGKITIFPITFFRLPL